MDKIQYEIIRYGIFDSSVIFSDVVTTKDRRLDCFEFELFTSDNEGVAYINGTPHRLEKGLLICGKPGQLRHSRLHFTCCYLHVKSDDTQLLSLLYPLSDATMMTDYASLAALFYQMAAHENETVCDTLFLQCTADRILYHLLKAAGKRAPELSNSAVHADTLRDIKEYIKSSYAERLSLEALAKRANLSPIYFHRLFSEYYHMTPSHYVLNVRLSAAKQLLIATRKTVMEIAADCGFSSQAYFNYIFKKHTGTTPLQYRRMMLSNMEI